MKTGYMKIYCSECREGFPMYPDRHWYNFEKEEHRDPIGFCSIECLAVHSVRRGYQN